MNVFKRVSRLNTLIFFIFFCHETKCYTTMTQLLQDGGKFLGMLDCNYFFPSQEHTKTVILGDGVVDVLNVVGYSCNVWLLIAFR